MNRATRWNDRGDVFTSIAVVITLTACGYLVGSGFAPLLANELFSPAPRITAWLTTNDGFGLTPSAWEPPWIEPIDLSSFFGEPETVDTNASSSGDATEATSCGDALHLVGVAHDHMRAERSVALVRDGDDTRAARIDETVGEWILLSTEPSRARLRRARDGRTCTLALFESRSETPTLEAPRTPDLGVREIAPGHFAIDRTLVQSLLARPRYRVMPITEGSTMTGARVFGIARNDPAYEGGLRNGDTLLAIDGRPIGHEEHLLETYARLQNGEAVEISVRRGVDVLALHYQLR